MWGAPAIVSDRAFALVLDPSLTATVLNVSITRLAYYAFFDISDSVRFSANLTPLTALGVSSEDLDLVKVRNVTLTYRGHLLYASLDIDTEYTQTS